jgi:hypothetical protein
MFPIYILDGKTVLPESGTFYVVAGNGIFLSKDTGLIRALVKVENIAILPKLKTSATMMMPRVPAEFIARSLLFFRRVYSTHHSEAIVLLYYSKEKQEYVVDVPPQKISAASLKYEPIAKYGKEGLQLVGTIHSHCDFGAFHSGVDVNDEKDFDGLHITIGMVDKPYFTISVTIAVNNNRFKFDDPAEAIEGLIKTEWTPPPIFSGFKRKRVPRGDFQTLKGGFLDQFSTALEKIEGGFGDFSYSADKTQYHDLVLPDGLDYRSFPVPAEWLERVKKKHFWTAKDKVKDGYVEELFVGDGVLPPIGENDFPVEEIVVPVEAETAKEVKV